VKYKCKFVDFCRKNVPDYSASRMMNDLGFVSFDLSAGNFLFLNHYFSVVTVPEFLLLVSFGQVFKNIFFFDDERVVIR